MFGQKLTNSRLLIIPVITSILGGLVHETAQFSEESLKMLAEKLGSRLHRITREVSAFDEIEKGFISSGAKIEETDPIKSLKTIRDGLGRTIHQKLVALKRLVDLAETVADEHKWDSGINTTYPNAKEPESHIWGYQPFELIQDSRFRNDAVNLQSSTLHIPTNVFSRSISIQNAAKWTSKLDMSFRYNLYQDPSLVSQYFASTTGFQRMYPGVKWAYSRGDPERPDMYDCRLTNWYIRAASSPKDVVILLDISGSMTGRRRDMARRTAIEIMNSLTDDDFFNILTFKEDTHFLDPCNNGTLVQATDVIKKRFEKLLFSLPTENFANYTVALPVAFNLLQRNDTKKTTNCNKAIMIVSDNAPDSFEDICSLYNPEKNVRFFAYVIGREVTQYEEMTQLACNNRGYVGHVITMADVRDHVQEYYKVMARPMILTNSHSQIWTDAYWHPRNIFGIVVSTAQPVFNRSATADHKGELLGVMGMDIPIDNFVKALMPYKWGVGSYVFGINHNGKVLFHPQWKTDQSSENYKIPRKPELDLASVEFEVNKTTIPHSFDMKLRTDMINQITGNVEMQVLRQLQEGKRIYERDYQYYHTPVPGTPFSVAIALPIGMGRPYSAKLRVVGRSALDSLAGFLQNTSWTVHPKWPYCNLVVLSNMTAVLLDNTAYDQNSATNTDNNETSTRNCDTELTESVAFDAKATFSAVNQWFADVTERNDLYSLYGILTCFTITRAGLTRWKDVGRSSEKLNSTDTVTSRLDDSDFGYADEQFSNSTENTEHYFRKYSLAVDEAFYERTIASAAEVTVSPMLQFGENANGPLQDTFMVTMPVFVGDESRNQAPAAIAGIVMRTSGLRNLVYQLAKTTCNGSTNCLSCHSKAIACYLLDENGYVVVDNRYPENSGRSFATLQSEVMNALVTEWEVYKKVVVRDYQDMCQPKRTEKSAGSASQPLMNLYAAFQGLLVLAKLLYGYVVLVLSLCRSVLTAEDYYIWESNGNDTTDQMPLPPPFPCETDKTLFTSTWNELKLSFQVNCSSNCTKHVEVYKVSLTNLILVALDGQRSCPCNENAFSAEAKQVIYTPEEECEVFSAFPYRRPPTDCFPYYAAEDASECGRPWVPYSDSSSGIGNLPLPSALVFFVSFPIMILT